MKDELFLRGAQVPMTKEAVRALALAKLELHRARHLIDIGAGTGSVSIEAERLAATVIFKRGERLAATGKVQARLAQRAYRNPLLLLQFALHRHLIAQRHSARRDNRLDRGHGGTQADIIAAVTGPREQQRYRLAGHVLQQRIEA